MFGYFSGVFSGAFALFLMDPTRGRGRRVRLAQRTTVVITSVSDTLDKTVENISRGSKRLKSKVNSWFKVEPSDSIEVEENPTELEDVVKAWTPTARFITAAIGSYLLTTSLFSSKFKTSRGLLGAFFALRSITNIPLKQLFGIKEESTSESEKEFKDVVES